VKKEMDEQNNQLEPFLPTGQEIQDMNLEEFSQLIYKAHREIPQRAEKRDPLFHLKKRISAIMDDKELNEVQKESQVFHAIDRYMRITSESR
jgi:hypothetical protein